MADPTFHRRNFLTATLATFTLARSGLGASALPAGEGIFLRPFAGSRTISSFADWLFWSEEFMPVALKRALDIELARMDQPMRSVTEERRLADYFARLAMHVIAPRALRRAGYERLAQGCENERQFAPGCAAVRAQHSIGCEFRSSDMPQIVSNAYGASAYASTCAGYAGYDEIDIFVESGGFCARALLSHGDYLDASEAIWVWNFAVKAINAAVDLSQGNQLDNVGV